MSSVFKIMNQGVIQGRRIFADVIEMGMHKCSPLRLRGYVEIAFREPTEQEKQLATGLGILKQGAFEEARLKNMKVFNSVPVLGVFMHPFAALYNGTIATGKAAYYDHQFRVLKDWSGGAHRGILEESHYTGKFLEVERARLERDVYRGLDDESLRIGR